MQIGYVSTFLPQRCGIATYLDYLTNPLRKLGVDIKIIAEKEAAARAEDGFEVIPCWGRKENYIEQILHHAQTVDVLHVQHEYSIYGFDDRLPTLLRTLEGKVKRVVTIHCIRPAQFSERGAVDEQYAKRIAELADAVIVHLETQQDILKRLGIPAEKINVIPHGSELIKVDQIESRKKLGLPLDAKLMLMFGFIKPHKCLHVVIEAMPTILEKVPNAILFVAGGLAPTAPPEHQAYVQRIEKQISELGIQAHVILPNRFFPNEDVPHLFGAVDVVLFPYYEEDVYGEVIICPEVVRKNAEKFSVAYEDELMSVMVHGILHLAGYDHERENRKADEMFKKQREYVERIKGEDKKWW